MSERAPEVELEVADDPPQELGDRLGAGFRLIAWGLVCTLGWLVVLVITQAVVVIIDGEADVSNEAGQLVFIVGQGVAGFVGWLLIPTLILHRQSRVQLISWRHPTMSDVGWAAAGLVGIYIALFVYTTIITVIGSDSLEPQSTIDDSTLYVHTSVVVALGVLVIGCAPIYEEAFARGFVLGGLRPYWGMIPALVVSSAAFSALHADLGSMIPFAIAGAILSLLYARTGSLTAPSLAHFGFNVIGFSATLLQEIG